MLILINMSISIFSKTINVIPTNKSNFVYMDMLEDKENLSIMIDKLHEQIHNLRAVIEFSLINHNRINQFQVLYNRYIKTLNERALYCLNRKLSKNPNVDIKLLINGEEFK